MEDSYYDGAQLTKHASLLKEATALKKNDLSGAIATIKIALDILVRYPISFKRPAIQKLANYESLNQNPSAALEILSDAYKEALTADDFYMRVMDASILVGYIPIILKKKKIDGTKIEFEAVKLMMIALAIQGRMDQIDTDLFSKNPDLKHFYDQNYEKLSFFQKRSELWLRDQDKWEADWINDSTLSDNFDRILADVIHEVDKLLLIVKTKLAEQN